MVYSKKIIYPTLTQSRSMILDTEYTSNPSGIISEQMWSVNLEDVKMYIKNSSGLPVVHTTEHEQAMICRWMATQSVNYEMSQYMMAIPSIRAKWDSFVNDPLYSHYFTVD
jgi:hypothetical protein